jgi:hypothetical protein
VGLHRAPDHHRAERHPPGLVHRARHRCGPAVRTGDDLTERAVASYIAKYVSKPEVAGVTVDRPIRDHATIAVLPVTEHTHTMIRTCWNLGGQGIADDLRTAREVGGDAS